MTNKLIHVTARLLVSLSRFRFVQSGLRKLALAFREEQILSVPAPNHQIPEVMAIDARQAHDIVGKRLNLFVPAVSQRHVFGGIETALQVFDTLRPYFDHVRIIVTDEAEPKPRLDAYYGSWPIVSMAAESPRSDHIVAAGSRWGQTLSVHPMDHFMATAWWTAHNAFALLDWQEECFPDLGQRSLIYLIQDFEPGFYPWSARYLLAEATYAHPARTVALINSVFLADYLQEQGHTFPVKKILHPRLHPALAAFRARHLSFSKERILLVYGRPGTERNAFSLIVAALRLWAMQYPGSNQWRIVSAGENFAPIDLGGGCQLISLGKLGIDDYAELLCRTGVGFSLMVSPHPSYPPLEMAAFGARVVTNRFANKDLSLVSPSLVSAEPPNPEGLASALLSLTADFDDQFESGIAVKKSDIVWNDEFLRTPDSTDAWAAEIAAWTVCDKAKEALRSNNTYTQ